MYIEYGFEYFLLSWRWKYSFNNAQEHAKPFKKQKYNSTKKP